MDFYSLREVKSGLGTSGINIMILSMRLHVLPISIWINPASNVSLLDNLQDGCGAS